MNRFLLFLIPFFFLSLPLAIADDRGATPDPMALEVNWWRPFQAEPTLFTQRSEAFLSQLKEQVSKSTLENREEAAGLLAKIESNFKAYTATKALSVPPLPPPPAYGEHYSISQYLDLLQRIRKQASLVKTEQDNLVDRQRQLETSEQHLETLFKAYFKQEGRSESKLIAGLRVIAFQSFLEISREKLTYHQKLANKQEEELKRLRQELVEAAKRIEGDTAETEKIFDESQRTEKAWTSIHHKLKERETANLNLVSSYPQDDKAKWDYQLNQQEFLQVSIEEASGYVQMLKKRIELRLAYLLNHSQNSHAETLGKDLKEWAKWLDLIQKRSQSWQRQIQRDAQRWESLPVGEGSDTRAITSIKQQLSRFSQSNSNAILRLNNDLEETHALLELVSKTHVQIQGWLAKTFSDSSDAIANLYESIYDGLNKVLFYIGSTPLTLAGIIRCLCIMFAAFWVSRLVLGAMTEIAHGRKDVNTSVVYRIKRLVHYLILTLGAIIALSSIGFDFSNFMLIAGALGVGLGFGLQSIFNNFISGIIILFESQLKVGDLIELESGLKGEVKEINVRSTYIRTSDGIGVIVPNSEFINCKVVNWTLEDHYRRVHIPFSVTLNSDKELLVRVLEEEAAKVYLTLPYPEFPKPKVYLTKLGDFGLEYVLTVWVDDAITKGNMLPMSVYSAMIHETLKKHQIDMSTHQLEVFFSRFLDKTKLEDMPHFSQLMTATLPNKN